MFSLETNRGHLKWKVTDLVRSSGFSRALIYRYLGGSREEMLRNGVLNFVAEFYGLESNDKNMIFSDRIRHARSQLDKFPEAVVFYLNWRGRESPIQKEFISVEKKFQKRLQGIFPTLSKLEILARHAVMHGLVTSPFLTPDQAAEIYRGLFEP